MQSKPDLLLCRGDIRALVVTCVFGTIVGLTIPAHAQLAASNVEEQVTVEASPYIVQRSPISGAPPTPKREERISVSRPVSLADLNPSSPADVAELERRITEAAKDVCRKATRHYPPYYIHPNDERKCVRTAIEEGMMRARQSILGMG
jgi:UrcA family protein